MNHFVSSAQLREVVKVGKSKLYDLRTEKKLLEGIHFIKMPGGKKILWNQELIHDFFITGGGSSHQQAIEAYLKSLPSNQSKKVGRKRLNEK